MLRSVKDLQSYKVNAEDGDVGTVSDFYFDDTYWTIRYLVADTGSFFRQRQVLISPIAFRDADASTKEFHVALTQEKVKGSPSIDLHLPVSSQRERDYYAYYGWPSYWGYDATWSWGMGPLPSSLVTDVPRAESQAPKAGDDPHLRSAKRVSGVDRVSGYHVQCPDGEIGHVMDFIVDDQTWDIRYLVIDTSNWWSGRKVLVAPRWAEEINWQANKVRLNLPRETVRSSPEWDPLAPVNREYEVRMYDYYGRPAYWQSPAATPSAPTVAAPTEAPPLEKTYGGVHPAL